jgi:hypothetical protein
MEIRTHIYIYIYIYIYIHKKLTMVSCLVQHLLRGHAITTTYRKRRVLGMVTGTFNRGHHHYGRIP